MMSRKKSKDKIHGKNPKSTFIIHGLSNGWTTLSFPILTDIYSEPIISQLCNVTPIEKPSIPRVKVVSKK